MANVLVVEKNNGNVVVLVVVVMVEEKKNGNVVVVVVEEEEENNKIVVVVVVVVNFMAFKTISKFCSWGVDMSWFCSVWEKSFSRKDRMQRHVMSKHRNVGLTRFQKVPFSQKCQRFRFEHPSTSIIAGMTGSGKTAWVRSLLQQASETIYPPPRGLFDVIHNGSLRIQKC